MMVNLRSDGVVRFLQVQHKVWAHSKGETLRPVPDELLDQLDFKKAIQQEAVTWRNLIPAEPWQAILLQKTDDFAEWVKIRLRAGVRNSSSPVVNAKKPSQGIRPVPIVGICERIAMRALSNLVLADVPPPNRAVADYRAFVLGPLNHAFKGLGAKLDFDESRIKYVVGSDVTAFYQYVDHEILRNELELQTGKIHETRALMDLLGEVQQSTFGLPQLIDSSDELSEVYIRILERDVVRRGLQVWRYNDDFRVGARTYAEAQKALETLSVSAHRVGLVLGEQKTFISKMITYFFRYSGEPVDDENAQINPEALEVDPEYPDLTEDERVDRAKAVLPRLDLPLGHVSKMNINNLTSDDLRALRQAISTLSRNKDEGGLSDRLIGLFLFASSLTPRLADYMVALFVSETARITAVWDRLTSEHSDKLSDWQLIWLVYIARSTDLLRNDSDGSRVAWLREQATPAVDGLLHAELCLALATVGSVEFSDLDVALRVRSEALAPWYLLAMKELIGKGGIDQNRVAAVKKSSRLYELILEA